MLSRNPILLLARPGLPGKVDVLSGVRSPEGGPLLFSAAAARTVPAIAEPRTTMRGPRGITSL